MLLCPAGGSVTVAYDGQTFTLSAASVWICRPGQSLTWEAQEEGTAVYQVGFLSDPPDAALRAAGIGEDVLFCLPDPKAFLPALRSCLRCAGTPSPSPLRMQAHLLTLLSLLSAARSPAVRQPSQLAARAIRYLEENYREGIRPRDVTAFLSVDRTYLYRVFKKKTGLSPEQYLIRLRIRKAAELLRGTSRTVTEISRQVGVPDPYHFSRLFKAYTGLSPTAFRRSDIKEVLFR